MADPLSSTLNPSLPEVHASVPVRGNWVRRALAFAGPGYLVSVGYMDPGNWATDIAGGSKYGYDLLVVVLLSSVLAIIMQMLAARLGIATGRDLAQLCRARYSRPVAIALWLACEAAIIACDLAEVIGTAIALQLLFGLPLMVGAALTVLDAFIVLALMRYGFRTLEAFVVALLLIIAVCFLLQIALAAPPVAAILAGFMPTTSIVTDPQKLYLAIGIIGATIMPHNLYLHSSIVQTRDYDRTPSGRREASRFAAIDSTVALSLALFVNAAILILAAAVFHANGRTEIAEIGDAHALLAPLLGAGFASTLFAIALLASGVNSTLTATLAGQIVMEGFVDLRLAPWKRRLITRGLAIIPVLAVTALYGESGTGELLVLSQIILSMQLPFAMVPLVMFVGSRSLMGPLAMSRGMAVIAWGTTALVIGLNLKLLWDSIGA
jgi:manganese transport protein